MASIDRYRPPREGYQPPSLSTKPAAAAGRPSKSPSSRRDVPPAVPSPPTHSSRTSSLPPQSRRGAPSPAHHSPTSASRLRASQWYFTSDEALSSPSIVDGLMPADERLRRAKGVNFIYQAGAMIELPQTTLWVAAVFFHRFYMRCSMVEEKGGIHHYNIAATALFLANKTEENCRKTKDLIYAVVRVAQKNPKLIVDEQSKEYWKWRDSILMHEEMMLEMLTFDLMVDNPYQRLYECLTQLEMLHHRPIRDAAWAYCCDSALTVLPLLMNAKEVAISAIYFATVSLGEKIEDDKDGEAWWRVLNGDESLLQSAISVVMDFYSENPLRKSDSRYQGSPAFSLENTRRGRDFPSQTEGGSSQNGTPMDTDRGGTQSPRARNQGRADRDDDDNGRADSKREVDDGNGLRSPGVKRRSPEADLDESPVDRDQKRARLSDEDEGEVRESS
ncbi:cyclin-like protein [Cryphonectria parasitica EP155]|uniref:RNA polymerase II holoenzyme cyclin-like subunit n=1 Tax=Cryphonectria parasitica (strain ATCC 38755 / EP155) TaxID=660469 RepID=A0A9P4XXS4_CRYP1|nr:cyclin-like protein [Cryphonectria parasitica EP155]KAF3762525.1 cyclin-like protein [Cryphonectria parasitica EP155]